MEEKKSASGPHRRKEISDNQKKNSHSCHPKGVTRRVARRRDDWSCTQTEEETAVGPSCTARREVRRGTRAGAGARTWAAGGAGGWIAGGRAGLGVVKAPGGEQCRSRFPRKSSVTANFHGRFPVENAKPVCERERLLPRLRCWTSPRSRVRPLPVWAGKP